MSLVKDPTLLAGANSAGNVMLFTPNPLQPGSSISHFDSSALPNLLMEPSISSSLSPPELDLTVNLMEDIGWPLGGGANIVLQFAGAAGSGFNHPSLGTARRAAIQRAAEIWAAVLNSSVPIYLQVSFANLPCSAADGATLAQASPDYYFVVAGAPFPDTIYTGILAEALTGQNLSIADNPNATAPDAHLTFNELLDQNCLGNGSSWDYRTSGPAAAGQISFLATALHEMAHAFGFANFINETNGAKAEGLPDVYSQFILDTSLNKTWANMTASQIVASAVRTGSVVWRGNSVKKKAAKILEPSPVLRVDSPTAVQKKWPVGTAAFGPAIGNKLSGKEIAIGRDGSAAPNLACQTITNGKALKGKIAVIDRGDCTFVVKVKNAQNAGAIAVVIVNNLEGTLTLGGDDPTISIPAVSLGKKEGDILKDLILNPPPPDDPGGGGDPGGGDPGGGDPGGGDPAKPLVEDLPEEAPSACVTDPTTLCLSDSRFRVSSIYRTYTDQGTLAKEGPGQAAALSADTGSFWFFNSTNVEVVVKVINACGFSQRFWVFAGGLTNVEVELRVVDTQTGKGKLYRNLKETPFQPLQDTSAFATCP